MTVTDAGFEGHATLTVTPQTTASEVYDEIEQWWLWLLGEIPPPVDYGLSTLMEVAAWVYTHTSRIAAEIQRLEAEGLVERGSALYHVRTGEIRTLQEVARKAQELGSRRLSAVEISGELDGHAPYA